MRQRSFLVWSLMSLLYAGSCEMGQEDSGGVPGASPPTAMSPTDPTYVGTGRAEIRLVDAPTDQVKEIVVTIIRVEAHVAGGGGWKVLAEGERTIDLLSLQGGTFASLGITKMPTGKIGMFRLYVKEGAQNYVTTLDGKRHPLKTPSGVESGLKFKGGFEWPACADGQLTIDFDGKKSIHVHPKGGGAGDEWILRPVIRLKSVVFKGGKCPDEGGTPGGTGGATATGGTSGAGTGGAPGTGGTAGGSMTPAPAPNDGPGVIDNSPPMTTPDACTQMTCAGADMACWNGVCTKLVP